MCSTVTGYNFLNTYQIEYMCSAPKIKINTFSLDIYC